MKDKGDLVRGWMRKAASDFISMEATSRAGAFDAACFHAQQSAEKYLKAYLLFHDRDFPYTHNLGELAELCSGIDGAFQTVVQMASELTPYAVRLRYDDDFWPSAQVAETAASAASRIRDLVLSRLPAEVIRG